MLKQVIENLFGGLDPVGVLGVIVDRDKMQRFDRVGTRLGKQTKNLIRLQVPIVGDALLELRIAFPSRDRRPAHAATMGRLLLSLSRRKSRRDQIVFARARNASPCITVCRMAPKKEPTGTPSRPSAPTGTRHRRLSRLLSRAPVLRVEQRLEALAATVVQPSRAGRRKTQFTQGQFPRQGRPGEAVNSVDNRPLQPRQLRQSVAQDIHIAGRTPFGTVGLVNVVLLAACPSLVMLPLVHGVPGDLPRRRGTGERLPRRARSAGRGAAVGVVGGDRAEHADQADLDQVIERRRMPKSVAAGRADHEGSHRGDQRFNRGDRAGLGVGEKLPYLFCGQVKDVKGA